MAKTAIEYELLTRLIQGDRAAFDAIYHQYIHPIYSNALKITRDAASAEDIVQEVFITLWEKKETIDATRSIGGWLFVICYNKSVNALRKKLRDSLASREFQPDADTEPDESRYNVQWEILEGAISQLSPQKRKVFELCKLEGKSYEETALALQISRHTVKEYLSAAISFIREYAQHHPESSVAITAGVWVLLAQNG